MRQETRIARACALVALLAVTFAFPAHAASRSRVATHPAAAEAAASKSASKSKDALRQFSGVVTALDKTSITVEKGGKKPKTMVFTRHAEMNTQGDLEREAKVTVYYRDEDGKPVARKVVVKDADGS